MRKVISFIYGALHLAYKAFMLTIFDRNHPVRTLVEAGVILYAKGRIDAAIEISLEITHMDPTNTFAEQLLDIAVQKKSHLDEVITAYREIIRHTPEDPRGAGYNIDLSRMHYNLGVALYETGNVAEARQEWEKVLTLDDGGWRGRAKEMLHKTSQPESR